MPSPPCPADGLISTGNSVTVSGSVNDGRTGTPASSTCALVSSLECRTPIVSAGGPMKIMPASVTAAAKSGSSASGPLPGCRAFAPDRRAAAIIFSPRRYVDAGVPPVRCTA